jgi:hypothetical protein
MAWLLHRRAAFLAIAGALLAVGTASAQEAPPADWLAAQVNERGQHCEKRAQRGDGKQLLLACGAAGVWEVTLSASGPHFVQSYVFAGDAVGFFTAPDGMLWVKLQVLEARPLSAASSGGAVQLPESGAAAAQPVAKPEPSSPALTPVTPALRRTSGLVVSASPGQAVVSLGTADGIARGDRIELSQDHLDNGTGEAALSREVLAVGVVTNVTELRAKLRLGLNESVAVGAQASRTEAALSASLAAPPRASGIWALELTLRPFAALGELGAGVVLNAAIVRRFGSFNLRALVDPLALADVKAGDSVQAVNAAIIASYDSQYFEMGLGLGAQTVNQVGFGLAPGSGLAVDQLIRLGAQDGFNVSARTSVVLFHSEFVFGGMLGSMQIPVTRGYWLLFGGGGGNVGYGYGEFGLRALLSGNGFAGSKFLTVAAGGAAVFRSSKCDEFFNCSQEISYGGPMASIGGEWRF